MVANARCFPSFNRSLAGQKGQALILGLLFTGVAAIVVLLMFNSAILTTTKSQLQNAADAGAYSAAVLQARDSNFSAYTNRAMIANQVAVAQFVSLKSYFDDAAQTHNRVNSVVDDAYRFVAAFAPAWDVGKRVPIPAARNAVDTAAPLAVRALDLLIVALETAQQVNHVGTMTNMMLVADDVVKKNDPQAGVTKSAFMVGDAFLNVTNWGNNSQKQFSANDTSKTADRFADAVVSEDSTDAFVRNRASALLPLWASPVKPFLCPGAEITFTAYAIGHFGGTLLSSNKKRWLALDASQGEGFATCVWFVPPPVFVVVVTVPFPDVSLTAPFLGGSAGAVAGAGGRYNDKSGYKNNPSSSNLYGDALISPSALPALYRYNIGGPGGTLDANGGLQKYYRDVADPTGVKPKNQSAMENGGKFPITVEVERTADTIRDSTKILPGSEQLKLQGQLKGDTMRALASAQSYFYRPKLDNLSRFTRNGWQRGDNKTEVENLFSPYWQARLAPTSVKEEAASALAQGGP